jgi:primosomal protein N' (replication factor Y)
MPPPRACPECGDEDSLVACGPGVERIADEVAALFPDARLAVATSDTLATTERVAAFVADMEANQTNIVIGTQLVTKGYHFPNLTLVGVVDADLGLTGGDLRAAERSFQQIMQVAGRAGRAEKPGRVVLQTHEPGAPVIQALLSGDSARFYATESEARREAEAPPFGRYAALIISSEQREAAGHYATRLGRAAPRAAHIHVYGPAPAPLAMLRKRHRFRLLVHASRKAPLQAYLRQWLSAYPVPRNVRLQVDVDPYSFG